MGGGHGLVEVVKSGHRAAWKYSSALRSAVASELQLGEDLGEGVMTFGDWYLIGVPLVGRAFHRIRSLS